MTAIHKTAYLEKVRKAAYLSSASQSQLAKPHIKKSKFLKPKMTMLVIFTREYTLIQNKVTLSSVVLTCKLLLARIHLEKPKIPSAILSIVGLRKTKRTS